MLGLLGHQNLTRKLLLSDQTIMVKTRQLISGGGVQQYISIQSMASPPYLTQPSHQIVLNLGKSL